MKANSQVGKPRITPALNFGLKRGKFVDTINKPNHQAFSCSFGIFYAPPEMTSLYYTEIPNINLNFSEAFSGVAFDQKRCFLKNIHPKTKLLYRKKCPTKDLPLGVRFSFFFSFPQGGAVRPTGLRLCFSPTPFFPMLRVIILFNFQPFFKVDAFFWKFPP
ncbi:MAG: hypothetical protein Ct9H300mP23_09030 [Nitrospinota bacterium]|nr:MAG: hypothetical protein Ct9H300mP23_09030 [Nitrospinota bacterium]